MGDLHLSFWGCEQAATAYMSCGEALLQAARSGRSAAHQLLAQISGSRKVEGQRPVLNWGLQENHQRLIFYEHPGVDKYKLFVP